MHESIHDEPEKTINHLFHKLKINIYTKNEFKYILKEISPNKFGISSAEDSLKKCLDLSLNTKISNILQELHQKYIDLYLSI